MKFTCERCGKKYATAEDPAPGRVYKLKCKACGHLIVVKASAAAASEHPASPPPEPPSIGLEIGTPEPARVPPLPGPNAFDATTDVSTAQMRSQHDLELTPRKGDSGYVDLFSDVATSEAPQTGEGEDPFLAAARNSLPEGYGGAGSNAPDPFAGLREDISATSAPSEPPPRSQPSVPKVPLIPKPKQVKSAVPLVLIGAGVAVLVGILAFVLLSSGTRPPPRASPPPVATAAPPVPAPSPVPVAAPPPEAAQPAPATPATTQAPPPPRTDDAEKRARAEQKRKEREEAAARAEQARAEKDAKDREARAERDARDREARAQARAEKEARDRAAREAKDREKAEREAKAKADREAKAEQARLDREAKAQRDREARAERERAAAEAKERDRLARQAAAAESAAAEPEGGLTQAQIESVLRSTKSAFDGCIQAARGKETLDGRRVMLRLNIQTTGAVTYPTLDDVTLNGTDLGTCLKSAARLMVFPKFKGDTMHVEVPLVMR